MGDTTVDNLVLQYTTRGEAGLRSSLRGVGGALGKVESQFESMGLAANALGAIGGYKVLSFLKNTSAASLSAAGDLQVTEKAYAKLIGSAQGGAKAVQDALNFARNTPYDLKQVTAGEQQLLAMGFAAKELIPDMKALGDLTSALGGDSQKLGRLTYRLGEIRAQGKAYARDLMDLGRNGVPYMDIMTAGLGKAVTKDQLTEMSGEDFVAAFIKGANMKFGGMMDQMMQTVPGQLHKLDNAALMLKQDFGKMLTGDATHFIGELTKVTDKLDNLVKYHPALAKGLLGGGALVVGGATGIFALGTLAGAYKNITNLIGKTSDAKNVLTKATKADTLAEGTKALVAGKEGRAIGDVGVMAERAAKSKLGLVAATKEATNYAVMHEAQVAKMMAGGVSRANAERMAATSLARYGILPEAAAVAPASMWTRAGRLVGSARRGAMGLAGRAGNFLSAPAFGDMATGASSSIGGAGRYEFLGMGRYRDTLTGKFAGRDAAMAWNAESEGAGGLRNALGGISNARLLGGAAMGAGVGVQSYDNWKKAGATTGEALAASTTTGISAGMITLFQPEAAIPIMVGQGLAWAINKYVNDPMEKAAQGSISNQEMAATSKMSPAQLAQFYFKKRDEALARGDSTEAQSYLYNANQQQRKAKKQAEVADEAARDAARAKSNQEDVAYNKINSIRGAFSNPVVDKSRNDAWTIKIPGSPADKSHRTMKYNANTPAPAYL